MRIRTLLLALLLLLSPATAEAKILLTGTSDLVQVITASAVTTIYVHASWADITTTALTPGRTNTQITTATTTTAVGSPAASTQRQVKILTIRNSHASSSNAITIQHTDGTTIAEILKYTLLAGETIQYTDDDGFRVIDASGQIKSLVAATQSGTWTVQPGNTANTTAWLTTGTGGTFPVTGTFWQATQPVSGTFWQATQPVSGTFWQGTQPVSIATNTPSGSVAHDGVGTGVDPLLTGCYSSAAAPTDVSADGDATRAWCLRNGARAVQPTFAGILQSTGNGTAGTGTPRVTIASDNTAFAVNSTLSAETTKVIGTVRVQGNAGAAFDAATGAAPPANAILAGGIVSGATGGFLGGIPVCDSQAVVNVSTATTTLIVTGVSGRHVRICGFELVTAAANNVAFLSGTGATCGTGTAGMSGGTTAASGYNLAANGGIAHGSGIGTVKRTVATGDSVCLITSAATQLSGSLSYTIY